MHTSSSSFAAALVASALIASSSSGVEALPTHRSTSTISRRAHLASHGHAHVARSSGTVASLGDHSIVVDASTSSAQGNGGIKNSTINLTSISRRDPPPSNNEESTFSSFARVVRSLFSSSSPSPSPSSSTLPLITRSTRRSHGTQPPKHVRRLPLAQRSIALAGAKAPRSALRGATRSHEQQVKRRKEGGHNHPRNVKQQQRRSPYPPPSSAVSPRVEERAITYDAAPAQASAYSAAVAALASSDSTPQLATASPVVEAAMASPSANAAAYADLDSSSLFNANSSSAALPPIVMTVTQTVTLVPSGLGGAYVDAAGLSAPAPLPTSAVNPKAVPSASPSSSSDSLSSPATEEEPLSTLVLPLSPSSSPSPSPSVAASGMQRRVKRGIAHKRARQVHVGGKAVEGSKVVWYHAPHASE